MRKLIQKYSRYSIAVVGCLMMLGAISQTEAGTLENMERERAILIDTLRGSDLTAEERAGKVEVSRQRLIDLERMVLRDDSLTGRNTPTVRRAFANYDLTFIVHSALEQNVSVLDTWLAQLDLSTQAVMNARLGRR